MSLNENYQTDDRRYIKQRSEQWHAIRNDARVTGSTAIGLGILGQQQEHYDIVIQKKKKPDTSLEIQKRMEFGTLNEIDALATQTAKVLPFLFPDLDYFEEGCQKVHSNHSWL